MMTLAAVFCCAMTTVVLTACSDDNIDNPMPTVSTEQFVEPTEDALSVKVDGNYVVYGELDHGFDKALRRRLQGSMTSPMNADCFVFDMATLDENSLNLDEWKEMVRRCQSGEASYVITQCSFKDFYDFTVLYILTAMAIELDNYQGDIDTNTQAEAKARMKQRMANVMRNAYMAGAQADGAMTRGTEVNGQELDWENIDKWPAEKQNAIMFDAYAFCGGNEIYVLNAEASKYMNGEEADQPDNDYEWGQKADAIADWLNRQRKQDDAKTRAELADFTRAVHRAGGSTAISDLMSAQTKEFVFDYKSPHLYNTSTWTAHSAIKVQYAVYSAYDFGGNVEYYQVRQNITVMNDKIFTAYEGHSWGLRSDDGKWVLARGAYMKSIDTKMWLEGSGTKSIVSAAPLNENGSSSGSSTTGGASGSSDGWSTSNGFSAGVAVGFMTAEVSASYNYTHTTEHSTTREISWNTTTNWNTKDLTTVFTQGNDANATVTWKHIGYTPTNGDDVQVSRLKPLLRSTCVTDEQTLWKVENPSGIYTLKANLNVVSEIYKINQSGSEGAKMTQDNPHDICFDLIAPNRFKVKWNNVVYDYGTAPEGMSMIEYSEYIDRFIEKTYGSGSANFCWAGLFTSTEATADGSDNARAVFKTFKNSIRGMKQQLRAKGARGRIVFGLKHDGVDEDLIDQIILNLDGTVYAEGDILTETLNGYDLTYKVTKKDAEVMLYRVPDNFTGVLNIPETVCGLEVTTLGNNSAVHRTGITAVTIPATVHTIENGALAELNITEVNVPEGVQVISTWAFHADKEVTKVWLPASLKKIDYSAFRSMDKLAEVHIRATTPPTIGDFIFYPSYDTATLYVPKGYIQEYRNAREWWYFKNIVEE